MALRRCSGLAMAGFESEAEQRLILRDMHMRGILSARRWTRESGLAFLLPENKLLLPELSGFNGQTTREFVTWVDRTLPALREEVA